MSDYRVLLIDDDHRLAELLDSYLVPNGFAVDHAADGRRGLSQLAADTYDAVLLDIMMPGMDGLSVLRSIRETRSVPVIMLTARGDDADRIVGLELGADDYVPKPFNPRELLARLRAVLRRASSSLVGEHVEVGGINIDVGGRVVKRDAETIELTAIEFDILLALARRAGRVVTRDGLLTAAGRDDVVVGDRTVDVHISHLRRKLGSDGHSLIKTVRGVGYVMARS